MINSIDKDYAELERVLGMYVAHLDAFLPEPQPKLPETHSPPFRADASYDRLCASEGFAAQLEGIHARREFCDRCGRDIRIGSIRCKCGWYRAHPSL